MGKNNSFQENFLRGYLGKEEDASQARVLYSPEPLTNEMLKFKKIYYVWVVVFILSLVIPNIWALGLLGLMVTYSIDSAIVANKRNRLRRFKFKISRNVNNESLFLTMQPILIYKYNMLVEKRQDGIMTLTHNGYIYDVMIENDGTFIIWWRMSVQRSFVTMNKYKSYKNILAAMGIIAYEIQYAVGID